jgi:hypothetical protein
MDYPPTTVLDIPCCKKYVPNINYSSKKIHIGQRKLFISHLQYLTKSIDNLNKIHFLVYAGASPGLTSKKLSDMLFPNVKFILFDPCEFQVEGVHLFTSDVNFSQKIKQSNERIFLFNEIFSSKVAEKIKNNFKNILFISDIRLSPGPSSFPTDFNVLKCTCMQFNWVNELQPKTASLKFRQPFYTDNSVSESHNQEREFIHARDVFGVDFINNYFNKTFTYFTGIYLIQPWSGRTSSETRLYIDSINEFTTEILDVDLYEEKMFYFNTCQRNIMNFFQPVKNKCNCADCSLESMIISEYVAKYNIYSVSWIQEYTNKNFKTIH